ncbi:hypothetical protein SAMN06265171_105211 [Chryseobacterium rhizoplanae]|uniref:Uncharacterized protein n=1 Tax=Chryseobacterium rhizoplanae TaxID=1609531 RepID=A0A521DKQ5_9FLAO|nr:hypothetical protein SAMN06265171_105211 [Chryseobacterium rhizoplanae]
MKKKDEYQHYMGMSKLQIFIEMNDQANYYMANKWEYHINTNLFGKKTILILFFRKDIVYKIRIKKTYKKIVPQTLYYV